MPFRVPTLTGLESKILENIEKQGPLDFPGGKVRAYFKGRKIVDVSYGKVWHYYDVASLTKILFTTSVLMRLWQDKQLSLTRSLQAYIPWYRYKGKNLKLLLSHSAGYVDWMPFFEGIDLSLVPEDRQSQLVRMIRECRPGRSKLSKYSDIDFFLLGAVLENVCQMPLFEVWQNFKSQFFEKSEIHFSKNNKAPFSKKLYAPTETCPWRKKTLQGEVHDDNAWSLGGVAPHAGLFSTMDDMGRWVLHLRKIQNGTVGFVTPSTLAMFTKASMPTHQGYWGLGFMKPSPGSTSGKYFSKSSYGHTGFTGTSLWMDPKRDLQVILLSNRVHPKRSNRDFLELRPQIHDWIVQAVNS